MAEPTGDRPTARLETVDDRLRAVETALTRLSQPGGGPPGYMPSLLPAVLPNVEPAHPWGRLSPLRELRLMLGMYFDPRYRLSRPGQLGIPAVVGLMLVNWFCLSWLIQIPLLPFLLPALERVALVVLAVVLYKLLSREAARYEAVLAYLNQYAR